MNDRRYPWVILVPRRPDISEWVDLDRADGSRLWEESMHVCHVLRQSFDGDKLNIAALGNLVSQLHVHHVLRRSDDPAWPGPVWGHSPAEPYKASELEALLAWMRSKWQ